MMVRGFPAPCQWSEAAFRRRPCSMGGVELGRVPAQRFGRPQGLLDAAGMQGIDTAGGGTLQSLAALTTRFGRRRQSFSVPRLRHGMHRPAAATRRSGAGAGVAGRAALPRLRWQRAGQPVGGRVCSRLPRATARPVDCSRPNLIIPLMKVQPCRRMALLSLDRLPCSRSAGLRVRLCW